MEIRAHAKATSAGGNVRVSWLREGVLGITFRGRLGTAEIEAAMSQLAALTEHRSLEGVLIDTLAIEGFMLHVGERAERALLLARERGARRVAFAVATDASRMMTASVAFAVQLPVKMFATRAEALAYLDA
ncbi:STAS/SEC14 domain-containing protein [Chondromyces apiculatus]|uniref:STAS/SEC14 domain-containing protein n=1 Tax=Chondromyces apiculatus DSM 436 TaxID=1192034 RepID=A0A017THI7_9BACT|nr:STAS/SEC14 domain-containing protein [Chondromyces apiculatus]EYF08377.1 Hypothetical protein CAP_4993 [Chondromyces apiculatus DSM 436]